MGNLEGMDLVIAEHHVQIHLLDAEDLVAAVKVRDINNNPLGNI